MSYSYSILGGSINGSALDTVAIDGYSFIYHTLDGDGYCSADGTADVHVYNQYTADGYVEVSGYSAAVYAQKQVVGGTVIVDPTVTAHNWAFRQDPSGNVVAQGTAIPTTRIMVQVLHTPRTLYIKDENREAVILPYDVEAAVVRTEDREAVVPLLDSYY